MATGSRADYGPLRPVMTALKASMGVTLQVVASGMHLSARHGLTLREIERDGFTVDATVDMDLTSDTPEAIGRSMGLCVMGMTERLHALKPDILVLLGDRFETLAAATAALPANIPIAHIHGGEITEGAIDDAIRHALTKMSHLHFASTEAYRDRIVQMGEEPWRVTVSGAPSLDSFATLPLIEWSELASELEIDPAERPLLVTYHPVTLEPGETATHIDALLSALEATSLPIVFTGVNADTAWRDVAERVSAFVARYPKAKLFANLGTLRYASLMAAARAMIGNSSSGIIEAASFALPVVDVGRRQAGRIRGKNVISTGNGRDEILAGIRAALDSAFGRGLTDLKNPYGDGQAASRIVGMLTGVELGTKLLTKRFHSAS